jgi:hypothetical protein
MRPASRPAVSAAAIIPRDCVAQETVLQGYPFGQGWRYDTGYLDDPDILRPSEFQHPVQGRDRDGDFRGLGLVRSRS